MKYIHPQRPKLMNHRSGEGLPGVSLGFSKGNSQQHQIQSDRDSKTFLCAHLPPPIPGLGNWAETSGLVRHKLCCTEQHNWISVSKKGRKLFSSKITNTFSTEKYISSFWFSVNLLSSTGNGSATLAGTSLFCLGEAKFGSLKFV